MKFARVLLTIVLALVMLTGAVSCSFSFLTPPHSEELELKIYDYLQEKYPGLEFEIKSYKQDTFTSGKYVFNVTCKTTEIDFLVYQSSFLTTDSYTVTYANLSMEEMLVGLLGETIMSTHAKSIQWLDMYADGNTGYRFREVDLTSLPESALGIENIYKIVLRSQDTETALQSLKAITEKLTNEELQCDTITFEWIQNDYTIEFTTNTYTLTEATEEELLGFLTYVDEAKKTDEFVTISFVSRIKKTQLLLDKMESTENIPGFSVQQNVQSDNAEETAE